MLPKSKEEMPEMGLIYNRDLNACINIAYALTRGVGWGRCESPKPADEGIGVKPALNAGSSRLWSGSSSHEVMCYKEW
jgi:hypothetical protein